MTRHFEAIRVYFLTNIVWSSNSEYIERCDLKRVCWPDCNSVREQVQSLNFKLSYLPHFKSKLSKICVQIEALGVYFLMVVISCSNSKYRKSYRLLSKDKSWVPTHILVFYLSHAQGHSRPLAMALITPFIDVILYS